MNYELERLLQRDFMEIAALPLPWKELKGKSIFTTGGTGFIGSYLIKCLCWLNRQMSLGISFQLLRRSGAKPPFTDPCVRWIEGEIDQDFLPDTLSPDIIIHMASPASSRAFQENPVELAKTNILATRYLLERAKRCNSTFVFFSSAAVYLSQNARSAETEPSVLAAPGSAFSLYGASKLAGELLCKEFCQKRHVDCRIVRPFNIHGPGDSLRCGRFFPDFLRQAMEEPEIIVTGSGKPVRDSCYLSDFVGGVLHVLLKGENTIYNIGNEDNACTILEFAQRISELCGNRKVVGPLGMTTHTAGDILVPDTSRLRRLGWRPRIDLRTCIRYCLDSYQMAENI